MSVCLVRKYLLLDIHGSLSIHLTWEKTVQEVYSALVKAPLADFYLLWTPPQTARQAKKLKFPSDGAWRYVYCPDASSLLLFLPLYHQTQRQEDG